MQAYNPYTNIWKMQVPGDLTCYIPYFCMVYQTQTNMASDDQLKIWIHLNYFFPDWLSALSILQTELWKSKEFIKKKRKIHDICKSFFITATFGTLSGYLNLVKKNSVQLFITLLLFFFHTWDWSLFDSCSPLWRK